MAVTPRDPQEAKPDRVAEQQEAYAAWLTAGTRLGLALLVATFLAYVLGLPAPHVPIEHLPRLWTLPAHEFRSATGAPSGWGWIALLDKGDYLTYPGIAVLGLTSLACFVRVAAALAARGERLFAAIALAQIAVILLAASGLVSGGH
jgi:hypothetical protein